MCLLLGQEMKVLKKTIIVLISLILIFLLIYCFNLKRRNEDIKNEIAVLKNQKQEVTKLLIHLNEDLDKLKDENFELELFKKELEKINKSENYDLYKNELKKYVEKNINDLVKHQPTQGGTWVLTKINFINPFELIIYYEDGHELMESKLIVTLVGNKIKITEKNI